MRTIERLQPIGGRGRDAAIDLLHDARDALGRDPISENKMLAIVFGAKDALGLLARDDGVPVGYAHIDRSAAESAVEIVTAPSLSHRAREEVTVELLTTAKSGLSSPGGGVLRLFIHDPDVGAVTLARRCGFTPTREVLILERRSLTDDAAPNGDPPIVSFRVGVDEQPWIAMNARAFFDHPEQGSWTTIDLLHRESQPWFDAEGFFCCWIDDRLAGTCWTKIHSGIDLRGELYVVSVDPDFQGRGLGRRLVQRGIAHLSEAGVPETILYTEASNAPAVALYTSFGFTTNSRTAVMTASVVHQ